MSTRFELARYEDRVAVRTLERHIRTCKDGCRDQGRAARKTACNVGWTLHETIVRRAHAEYALRAPKWTETIHLDEIDNEKRMAEFLRERDFHLAHRSSGKLGGPSTTIEGIDTSVWQGTFPWGEAVAQGMGCGIAKASEGTGYQDPQWANSVSWLLAQTGIVGGSYHFSREDLGNSAVNDANWYLSRHPAQCFATGQPWIFSHDAESAGGSAGWCYAFLSTVSARIGYSCWFYSYASWIQSRGVQAFGNPLWIAWPNPGDPPNLGWPAITMHQYGSRGFSVGQVDADRFWGDRAALLTLAGMGQAAPLIVPASAQGEGSVLVLSYNGATYRFWIRDIGRTDQYGPVAWGVFGGAEGAEEGYTGSDNDLGGLCEAGSLAGYIRPYGSSSRIAIYAKGLDGRLFRILLDGGNFSLVENWTPLPLRFNGVPATVKSVGVGSPGPATYVPHRHVMTEDTGTPSA